MNNIKLLPASTKPKWGEIGKFNGSERKKQADFYGGSFSLSIFGAKLWKMMRYSVLFCSFALIRSFA
jgi:hypothetical protein